MPDSDRQKSTPERRTLSVICGLTGLALALIWMLWPSMTDPFSSELSRTFLYGRQWTAPPVQPIVVEIAPASSSRPTRLDHLLQHLIADAPQVIALVDVDHGLTDLLEGFEAVQADPQAPTILRLAVEVGSGSRTKAQPPNFVLNQPVGMRSPSGALAFNLLTEGTIPGEALFVNRGSAAFARHRGVPSPLSGFAAVVTARTMTAPQHHEPNDGLRARFEGGLVKAPRDQGGFMVVKGGHRVFYDRIEAAAVIKGQLPRGRLQNRIVLLGASPGNGTATQTGQDRFDPVLEAVTLEIWALLNRQFAWRPHWVRGGEMVLILGLAFCPLILRRHFSVTMAWIANGLLVLSLVIGASIVWRLSGVLIQLGAGVLCVVLNGLIVSVGGHRGASARSAALSFGSAAGSPVSTPAFDTADTGLMPGAAPPQGLADPAPAASDVASASIPATAIRPQEAHFDRKIGRYQILRCIGKGAMGEVFMGRDPHINRLTAIKTLRFEENFAEEEIVEIKDKFFREAESAGTLSHANIVTIYDAGEDQDLAYIAMEYLEGITLLRFTRAKRLLPVRKVIAYIAQIAEALDYAHDKGIVHRDIKPANIMVLKNGEIKITDFGIARITTSSHTQTGVVKGTPYYMSPEQFSGVKVDGRSDIFSMGTMLFQLLTGTLPFFSESPAVLMNQIMNFPHPNPRAINPRVMPAIIPIVDKALEKQPDRRYAKAGHMAADLLNLSLRIDKYLKRKSRADQVS